LKKAAQKLLLFWACGAGTSTAQFKKSFFASFCSQKEAFFFAPHRQTARTGTS
jgi:hypothetical protein